MNEKVIANYSGLRYSVFILPSLLLLTIALYLFAQNALNESDYVNIQKGAFLHINSRLASFPALMYNLTQLGDALICLSLLSIFIKYAPTVWQSLIPASLISMIASSGLKNLFNMPRPAAALDTGSFNIIGETLPGHSSLPSGHSITIFTTLTILMFAFMPRQNIRRIVWFVIFVCAGLLLAFTRVGVGAHFPLDVLVGSTVGYISALAGIFISRKYPMWSWVGNRRYHPVFLLLLLACAVALADKIISNPLPVFYLTMAAIIFSLYSLTNAYFKK